MFKPDEYVVGGTVQAGDGVYIEREADQELLVLCRTRAFVYILSTRQVGKSSLIINVAKSLVNEGIAPVIIDLQESGVHELTADTWYIGFLTEVSDQLSVDVDVEKWWKERTNLPHGKRFTTFFKEVVLEQTQQPVVVFVDEIDTTRSLTFADDFYTAIRSIYNSRAIVPEFQRLSFVLVGAAAPTDLIRDTKRTPFNIGQRVELTDFTFNETLPLATRLALPEGTTRDITNHVLGWTSGHPYLTLALFRQIAEAVKAGKKDWTAQDVDSIVAQSFLGGQEDSNLRFVRDMLTIHAPDERVLNTYRDIYREKAPVVDEERSPIKAHLKLAGVVRSENGDLRVRNRIYREIYDEDWIRKHLPVNWTKRLQRAASVAVAIFFIALLPLSIFAWSQKQKAENALAAESTARHEAERLAQSEARAREAAEFAMLREAEARAAAESSAEKETEARHKAEQAEKQEANARRKAEESAESEKQARIQATASAERARRAMLLAEDRRIVAEQAVAKLQEATIAAQKAEAEARKAEEEARKAKEQADAKGQVAFARQLVIQAEAELQKNDTASASAFFANALLLDDQLDTRSRLLNTLLQVAKPFWTTEATAEAPSILALNGDGSVLATLIDYREIVISDTQTGTIKQRIPVSLGYGLTIVLDPAGRTLVSVTSEISSQPVPDQTNPDRRITAYDSKFTTYDVASGKQLNEVTFQTTSLTTAVSPDGKLAVVKATDGKTHILNLQTGKSQVLPTPEGELSAFTFSPVGDVLAATKNNELFLWDVKRTVPIRTINDVAFSGETNDFRSRIEFSPNGKELIWYREPTSSLVVPGTEQTAASVLTVWEVATGKQVGKLTPKETAANLAFTTDSDVILMHYTGRVLRWDTEDNQTVEVVSPEVSPLPVASGVFSRDGRKFAARSLGRDYQIFSVDGMKLTGTLAIGSKTVGHSNSVTAVAFDPKGKFVASGGKDSRLILWNATTGQLVRTLSEGVNVDSVAFSSDGKWLAYGGAGNLAIFLWNRETDEKKVLPTTVTINCVAFSPTESLLAAGTVNGQILIWTPKQGSTLQAFAPGTSPSPAQGVAVDISANAVTSIDFSRDGKWLGVVQGENQGVIRFYEVESRTIAHTFRNGNDSFQSLAFGTGGTFATASRGGSVRLWQIALNMLPGWVIGESKVLPGNFGAETTVTISPDGQRLAVANTGLTTSEEPASQYSVRVWDVNAKQWLTSVRGAFDAVAVQFSQDGRFLTAGATDGRVRLWEIKESLPFSSADGLDVNALSKDGELAVSIDHKIPNGGLILRNLKDGRVLQRLSGAQLSDLPIAEFSPDNKWFAAKLGGAVRVTDVTNGNFKDIPLAGAEVSDITFSADSRFVIVASRSTEVKGSEVGRNKAIIFELDSSKTSEVLFTGGSLFSVEISPDGKWLVMGGGGDGPRETKPKSLIVWDLVANKQSFSWHGKNGAILSLAFSAEQGKNKNEWVIATGEGNGESNPTDESIRLIDFKTQKQLRTFPGFSELVLSVSFTPRSSGYNLLVTAGEAYRAWDLDTNGPANLDGGLRLSTEKIPLRPSFSASGKFLVAVTPGQIRTWDLSQVNLIMNSRPEDIVSYVANLTQLNVQGLNELGFARLSQDQLKTLLGTKFRSNFTVVQAPTPTGSSDTMK